MDEANQSWNGNVGEWSEPYVLYKLLADGKLCQADGDLRPSPNDFVKIMSVVREDVTSELSGSGYVTFQPTAAKGDGEKKTVPVEDVAAKAARLFKEHLLSHNGQNGAFPIPWLEEELRSYGFTAHKNPIPDSARNVKRDITLIVHDPKSGGTPSLGFSVKSKVGSPPTLFNASEVTNLVYRVRGLSERDAEEINAYDGPKKLIWKCTKIKNLASEIKFEKYNSKVFGDNLDVVDAALPKIVADLVKVYYFEMLTGPRPQVKNVSHPHDRITRALELLNEKPPYCLHSRKNYCEIKIKHFLRACALGLMPSQVWNDVDDANGGYIVVLPNGELLGFFVYNRNVFEDYLLKETFFERGSTTKHKYMSLEADGNTGDYLLKLNLDIRFLNK